jgi:hypothetical protein
MIRAVAGLLLLGLTLAAGDIHRASLRALERSTDSTFEKVLREDPLSILGATRAVYLDGYGAVFTTEVELAASAAPNPFRPAFTKEEVAQLREKKKLRIAYLKETMRGILMQLAASLESVPLKENIALAVTIPYFRWEDGAGMPRQILLVAPRAALLDAKAGKGEALAAMKSQEFY